MVRPNPRYDPVSGIVTTPTAPREPRPNPRYETSNIVINDLAKLQRNLENAEKLADRQWGDYPYGNKGGASNPSLVPLPSWWHGLPFEVYENHYTKEQAIEYLKVSEKIIEARRAVLSYQCDVMNIESACQNLGLEGAGVLSRIRENIEFLQAQIIGLKEGSTAQDWTVKESGFVFPEILPEVFAEKEPVTAPVVTAPIPFSPPVIDDSINTNMVTQQVINFNIVNGRAVGSIRFVASNNFNPYYFNKPIANIIQIKDPNGVNILTYVKENRLNFTETERDEVINYDEDIKGNTRATIESFVWSSATKPTPFSQKFTVEISETEPPKPTTSGFMAAGVAGAIAGLVLLGFIVDSKVGKR